MLKWAGGFLSHSADSCFIGCEIDTPPYLGWGSCLDAVRIADGIVNLICRACIHSTSSF